MRRFSSILWAATLALSSLAAQTISSQPISIQLDGKDFRLLGWSPIAKPATGWQSVFSVRVDTPDAPPMLGTYTPEPNALLFHPRFPLTPGLTYVAEATLPNGLQAKAVLHTSAPRLSAETRVEHIYPSIDTLPANILKLYIHFSAPMSKGQAWQHIRLLDEQGRPVPLVFLEIEQELWDAAGKRLTVLFDPGRIKRGLVPTEDMGSAITEGRHYTLVVDKQWQDARGVALVEGSEKRFAGAPSDRTPPAPKLWKITEPADGTTNPLVIRFQKPMDAALLERMLRVEGVAGTITIADLEREWHFTPYTPWRAGEYRILANNLLEDISGNHLDKPFDVDLANSPRRETTSAGMTKLTFKVR